VVLLALAATSPRDGTARLRAAGGGGGLLSASQDVVIDAYRTDLLPGPSAAWARRSVMGYRWR
jgi:PAT family beta-lactamase induction signal transducer AmpG